MTLKSTIICLLTLSFYTLVKSQEWRDGYFLHSSLDGYWNAEAREGGVGVHAVNGLHFTDKLSAGIGVGVHTFTYVSLPISVRGYYFFSESISSPYAAVDLSYPITIEKGVHAKGSVSPEVSLGWTFKVGKVTMGPELGYRNERFRQRQFGFTGKIEDGMYVYEDLGYQGVFGHYIKFSYSVFF